MKLPERFPALARVVSEVAFTPKGGCPLKLRLGLGFRLGLRLVAFTPKGGCPLKPRSGDAMCGWGMSSSIHPQGWVPVETGAGSSASTGMVVVK